MVVEILFVVDNKTVNSGGTLNGCLQIVSTKDIPVDRLEVTFEGEEHAIVPTRETVRRGRYYRTRHDTQKFLCMEIETSRVNRMIQQRRHVFPQTSYEFQFSLRLPSLLPPSRIIHRDDGSGGCAKIEYALKAVLKGHGKKSRSYHASQIVQVNEEPTAPSLVTAAAVPRMIKPRCHKVKGTCFINQGEIYTGAKVKNSVLAAGQQLEIDLALINESCNSIRNIQVVVRERAHWSAQGHGKTVMTNLVALSLNANTSPGKSGTNLWIEKLQESHHQQQQRNLELIAHQLRTGSNLLSFTLPPIPQRAENTYVGYRLSVTHEVIITLESKRWTRNPEVRIPVKIVSQNHKTASESSNLILEAASSSKSAAAAGTVLVEDLDSESSLDSSSELRMPPETTPSCHNSSSIKVETIILGEC